MVNNSNFDAYKLAVESACPGNTVLLDDMGKPSVMVRVPKFNISDVIEGGSNSPHPAFIVNGVEVDEILISKYANIVEGERAYSQPMRDPAAYITFDQAKKYCENKGRGWHMMTNAEFAAIALWCQKNGFVPRGNTSYGKSHEQPQEHGTPTYKYGANNATIGRVATGSGPTSWLHNNSPSGIDGLCGNVWEWVSGMRVMDGEIQVIPDNNAAMGVDENRESTLWKAIMPDGRLVAPGTAGTLKYDSIAAGNANHNGANLGAMQLSTEVTHPQYTGGSTEEYYAYGQQTFESLGVKSGLVVPEIAKVLGLYPSKPEAGGHQGDYFYCRNYGERLPVRGGCWYDSERAGVFAFALDRWRFDSLRFLGVRAASFSWLT